jgi:hypothetical protein
MACTGNYRRGAGLCLNSVGACDKLMETSATHAGSVYFCTYKGSNVCESVVTYVTRLETSRPTAIRMLGYVLLVKSTILVTVNI